MLLISSFLMASGPLPPLAEGGSALGLLAVAARGEGDRTVGCSGVLMKLAGVVGLGVSGARHQGWAGVN